MVVGEAPGFEEEKAGEPFVGKSGQLLWMHLGALGLRKGDLYVTNVVKEIPLDEQGKIRRPTEVECIRWSSFLGVEIASVAPVALLCLGRTATDALMPQDTKAGERFGSYFAAWHPAHLLYHDEPDLKLQWIEQLRPFAEAVHDAEA
jgi:DNA polymerase